jgi:hypothetical protein
MEGGFYGLGGGRFLGQVFLPNDRRLQKLVLTRH